MEYKLINFTFGIFQIDSIMILHYINRAIEIASYKQLEDNSWFAEISECKGVWANGQSVEQCRAELIEVLEEWILLKTRDNEELPVINGIDINIKFAV